MNQKNGANVFLHPLRRGKSTSHFEWLNYINMLGPLAIRTMCQNYRTAAILRAGSGRSTVFHSNRRLIKLPVKSVALLHLMSVATMAELWHVLA